MRRAIGLLLTVTLVVGITYLAWDIFETTRNSDEAWDDAALPSYFLLCFILWAIIPVLAACFYIHRPSNRRCFLVVACSTCTFSAPFLGCYAGKYLWQREFDLNRHSADEVVKALQRHREKHGLYPASLAELESPVRVTFQRGRYEHRLGYRRTGKDGFVVEYNYGWYCYRYDSDEGQWSRFD